MMIWRPTLFLWKENNTQKHQVHIATIHTHTHTDTHFKFKISTSPIHSKVEKNNIQGLTGKCITPHIQSAVDTWFSEWLRKFT